MASPLTNDLLSQATFYTGFWINWTKEAGTGLTLTTTSTGGAVLIAFLAVFVQITGTHSWGILRFILHQYRVDKNPHDGFYHQQQSILRNMSSADASIYFLKVGWAWRSKKRRPIVGSFPLALVAIMHMGLFLVAAIFSATASTSSADEVLIYSPNCGSVSSETTDLNGIQNYIIPYGIKSMQDSVNYARSCYSSDAVAKPTENWHDCSTYATPRLPWNGTGNVACPFANEMCIAPAFQLDTGLIDSGMLGMNARPQDRTRYRKVTTCAPIAVDGFSQVKEGSSILSNYTMLSQIPELQYVELYYGQSYYYSQNGPGTLNYTYRYHTFLSNFTFEVQGSFPDEFQYFLSYVNAPSVNGFLPIAQLNRSDTDVTLAFLSANSMAHNTLVEDPWFSAHSYPFDVKVDADEYNGDSAGTQNGTLYFRDRPVTVLGCTEQHQVCKPNPVSSRGCTPLIGVTALLDALGNVDLNDAQAATANVIVSASASTGIAQVLEALGASALLARQTIYNGVQGPLPNNQWTLEVESWFNTVLAQLQRAVLEYATGPSDLNLLPFLKRPANPFEQNLCRNQMARTGQAQNFSVLAILLLLVLGTTIVCINLSLETMVGYFRRPRSHPNYRQLAWKTNNLLQTLRLAHEEVGSGEWSRCLNDVPVTERDQTLAGLNVDDPWHPKLGGSGLQRREPRQIMQEAKEPLVNALGPAQPKDVGTSNSASIPESPNDDLSSVRLVNSRQRPENMSSKALLTRRCRAYSL